MRASLYTSLSITLMASLGLTACNNVQSLDTSNPTTASPTVSHDAEMEQAHDEHGDTHVASWSYTGDKGPQNWGNLDGDESCKLGKEQSPINISTIYNSDKSAPQLNYNMSDVEVVNNGHTIVYTPQDKTNTAQIDGDTYTLLQFHYHAPSEHQISGVNYPAEVHFVHANSEGNLAVVGVMLNPTAVASEFGKLVDPSISATQSNNAEMVGNVDLNQLVPNNIKYYSYKGSLTTPPCSEQVKWFVANQALGVSNSEIVKLIGLYNDNNRPIQPQGDRKVTQVK